MLLIYSAEFWNIKSCKLAANNMLVRAFYCCCYINYTCLYLTALGKLMIFWNLGCDYQIDLLMKGSDQKM